MGMDRREIGDTSFIPGDDRGGRVADQNPP
jgi:hypothetical protein